MKRQITKGNKPKNALEAKQILTKLHSSEIILQSNRKNRSWTIRKIFWELLIAFGVLLGLISGIDQIWGPIWPTSLDLDPGLPDMFDPFSIPFVAKNRSVLFSIDNIDVDCFFAVSISSGRNISARNHVRTATIETIPADSNITFSCKQVFAPKYEVLQFAIMWVNVKYTRPFLPSMTTRRYGPYFYDTATNPPHWVNGIPVF